ncbi:peptidylprolyl isomerase [Rhodothermaceae bacterium RA]|nr:peptidylprolyl isomerase [Rhodothermaceae bacterium RA]
MSTYPFSRSLPVLLLSLAIVLGACEQEPEVVTTESGLQYIELERGDGEHPQPGQVVKVHYRGQVQGDSTIFDDSYERGVPLYFPVGSDRIIPGWDEGIQLMRVGGKARLIMPPELAFGEQGYAGVIPPNATLVFDVELLDVQEGAPEAPTEVPEDDFQMLEGGVAYVDLAEGEGEPLQEGDRATVHYTGWLQDGGKFDSSLDNGRPFTFVVGGNVIEGWSRGVVGMKVGGKRQIVIPPELAYGEQGAGPIPPNSTLVFEVELLDREPAPPLPDTTN